MSILNLSEVSRQFQLNRSTIYTAIKAGRLSRRADGNFDLVEIIRCFGEPSGQQLLNPDIQSGSTYKATQVDTEVVALLKQQITEYKQRENEYKDRETRLLDQIDRLQTLIEYRIPQQEKVTDEITNTTMVDKNSVAQESNKKTNEKQQIIEKNGNDIDLNCSQNMLQKNVDQQHKATLEIPQVVVAQNQPKKRGLFGRVLKAVLNDD